ncbi:nucleotidyl transferase AbiEii/AbiGii toxin family protein [Cryobacterium frigoriphilum]|uniref:Nucleotidyl transferase AbiEii/AbiGii toxin family protein n=1 Tax=Cryobacterium frigoriphilum TaxID=1259150 RepID=A0A4R8ZUQ1_9MICO|nr:nucleotidyl transferase AbiEii/AbiGii toxin family protein [Cryobacterium frigoriphilum]TFD46363.1 nucleotidyl transferase AbiEii/AbiGii toxin family protein [Cryobacterium frigoriphilum]
MTEPYRSATAVEAAIRDAARNAFASDRSMSTQDRIRQEHFRRFLSRIFSGRDDSGWLLKGGTGLLARVASGRRTTDVDLFRANNTLDGALAELIRLASIDLGDFFRFVYAKRQSAVGGDQQAYTDGYGVDFDVYIGADKKEPLHVDLVVGAIITDDVTVSAPANQLDLPRLPSNDYRLYPIVDQIADKVCATMADYNGRPSSREKDLVDLVVIAKTQTLSADALRRAIDAEARVRSLVTFAELTIPPTWGRLYAKQAKDVPFCADYRTVDLAAELMRVFIDMVLHHEVAGKTWSPDSLAWT